MQKIKTNGKEGKDLVKKILKRERDLILMSIKNTEKSIRSYELKYKVKSSIFLKNYLNGEMGDDENMMLWAAQIESLKKLKSELSSLSGVKIVS